MESLDGKKRMADGKHLFVLLVMTALVSTSIYVFVASKEVQFEYGKSGLNLRLQPAPPPSFLVAAKDTPSSYQSIMMANLGNPGAKARFKNGVREVKTPQSYQGIMESFLTLTGPNITNENWEGQCMYPFYIKDYAPKMLQQSWFQPFLRHLQLVDLAKAGTRYIVMRDCSRWWSATPQVVYDDPPPRSRLVGWQSKPAPPPGYKRPKCKNFGQTSVSKTSCSSKYEPLWRLFDRLDIVYFPRSGTELGIVRGGGYLNSDGDMDIYVDMPQRLLKKTLKKEGFQVKLREYSEPYWFRTEVHWHVKGCATVHIVFNDWMEDEMSHGNYSQRSGHADMCECLMNSVPMSCHKAAIYRTWLKYGPSWRAPLHAKGLDIPHRAFQYNVRKKLNGLVSKDDVIHEGSIRALDKNVNYTAPEMEMILAQLNDLHALMLCQRDARCLEG